jgi:hypothetical protein
MGGDWKGIHVRAIISRRLGHFHILIQYISSLLNTKFHVCCVRIKKYIMHIVHLFLDWMNANNDIFISVVIKES